MNKLRTGAFARRAGFSERIARAYADSGVIPVVRDSSGARLFDETQVDKAREIFLLRTAKTVGRKVA